MGWAALFPDHSRYAYRRTVENSAYVDPEHQDVWRREALDRCYQCYQIGVMAQLLVRDVDELIVRKLKRRAREHGVSAEEEHRRILAESLARGTRKKPSLIEFLCSREGTVAPEVELDLSRSGDAEERDTGF